MSAEATTLLRGAAAEHPISLHTITTPLRPFEFERELAQHPNKAFVRQLITDLTHGCNVGYKGPQFSHTHPHLPSAHLMPQVIDESLRRECDAGRLAGPYTDKPLPNLRCSGLGVVPKRGGGYRIIYDLSSPHGRSVNDFIDPQAYSLSYCTVDDAIQIVTRLGRGCLMGKIDLKNAFRQVPVRKQDWHLFGIYWKGLYYVDKCLPFGLRSAPYLFNQISEAIEWALRNNYGIEWILHFLDDFFTAGKANSNVCKHNMNAMTTLCKRVNAPLKPEKQEGPTTCLTFLGIELDSSTMEVRLPPDRKLELLQHLQQFRTKKKCTKWQLLSLIGRLSFACKVVAPGRIFLRRLIDLSCTVSGLNHRIRITREAQADIDWWLDFLPQWSGSSLMLQPEWTLSIDMELYSDASNLGYGAYWSGKWFLSGWTPDQDPLPIAWKELYAIVVACNAWGPQWSGKRILFHCDNQTIVQTWERGSSKSPDIMALVRALYRVAAEHNFHVLVSHISGASNTIADALSRMQMETFHQLAPGADPHPTPIPVSLMLL